MNNRQSVAPGDNLLRARGTTSSARGGSYEIKVGGHLDANWSEWLGGLHIQHEEQGSSLLSGYIPDQAALHGILAQIRDLGLTLISLNQMDVGEKG